MRNGPAVASRTVHGDISRALHGRPLWSPLSHQPDLRVVPYQRGRRSKAIQGEGFAVDLAGSVGNFCLGGEIGRYVGPGEIQSGGSQGQMSIQVDLSAMPQPVGPVPVNAGDIWYFQGWYRDVVGGSTVTSFSNRLSISFVQYARQSEECVDEATVSGLLEGEVIRCRCGATVMGEICVFREANSRARTASGQRLEGHA